MGEGKATSPKPQVFQEKMRLSHYLKVFQLTELPEYLLLFSTKKASKALIKKEVYQAALNGNLPINDRDNLLKLGIIAPDLVTEKEEVKNSIKQLNKNSKGLNLIIVLNMDCNFSCTYCYEKPIKSPLYMSEKTENELTSFIIKKLDEKEELVIDFYGGEPLLSKNAIIRISKKLKQWCEPHRVSYSFTLVTNGSLLTKETAQELKSYGLKSVKITVDGPAETHNESRPFKTGVGSFGIIMERIKQSRSLVEVNIGGNYTRKNYHKFPQLLDHLQQEGLTAESINSVKFDPVLNTPNNGMAVRDFSAGCECVNEEWLIKGSSGK
ncbi:MAG: radical SAM protein [Spirochaetota bacterium]